MAAQFGWPLETQGYLLSALPCGYILGNIPGGILVARGYGLYVLPIALGAWSAITVAVPTVATHHGVGYLLLLRFFMGFSEAFALPAIFGLLATRADDHLPTVLASGSIGVIFSTALCPMLAFWQHGFWIFGSLGLLCAVVWLSPVGPAKSYIQVNVPALDNETTPLKKKSQAPFMQKSELKDLPTPWDFITCVPLWAITLAMTANGWAGYLMFSWAPTYLVRELGVRASGLSILALPMVVGSLSQASAGRIAVFLHEDCGFSLWQVRRGLTIVALVGSTAFLCLFSLQTHLGLAMACCTCASGLQGLWVGGCLASHSDIASKELSGLTFAVSNTCATLPGIVLGPITTYVVRHYSWQANFFGACSTCTLAAIFFACFGTAERLFPKSDRGMSSGGRLRSAV
eukprot:TRINITY_DN67169_c0_g1_i1.p1 TRINITY_DN67169_c0_g1~~TRINITY_DN67169_c0_g1_i1.p1  ORF type:complete len:465 (+),score=55.15 TRINITY_DN67169_c0_g1_i1:192-1397(+)